MLFPSVRCPAFSWYIRCFSTQQSRMSRICSGAFPAFSAHMAHRIHGVSCCSVQVMIRCVSVRLPAYRRKSCTRSASASIRYSIYLRCWSDRLARFRVTIAASRAIPQRRISHVRFASSYKRKVSATAVPSTARIPIVRRYLRANSRLRLSAACITASCFFITGSALSVSGSRLSPPSGAVSASRLNSSVRARISSSFF